MSFEYAGMTAAQRARDILKSAGIPSRIRKGFRSGTGCYFLLTVPAVHAEKARRLLQGGRV